MKSFPAKKNQGFTLLEILLVIGIAAVIALAAFMAWPNVQSSQRANAEQSRAMTIAAGVKQAFNGRYAGIDDQVVVDAKIPPSDMINAAGDDMQSSWGDDVTVSEGTQTDNTDTSKFTITYTAVPENVCLKLVPGLAQTFEQVTVGGVAVRDDYAATAVAYSPTAVVTECAKLAASDVTISTN